TLHEFTPGVTQNVATSAAPIVFMHWATPSGAANVDYDLYVLDSTGTSVIGASTNTQNGTQDPFEIVGSANPLPAGARVVVGKKPGAANRMLWLQWYRGTLRAATSGATKGHNAAASAFTVAATPAFVPAGPPPNPVGPYPSFFTTANVVELFSSDGP